VFHDLYVLAYACTVGFVAAGITASFYKMVTAEPARFALLGESILGWATTLAFCALTGPVIVMDRAIRSRRTDRMPVGWLFAGVLVAGLWSICLGIVVLELVMGVRDTLA
jgi:hypothetical protein